MEAPWSNHSHNCTFPYFHHSYYNFFFDYSHFFYYYFYCSHYHYRHYYNYHYNYHYNYYYNYDYDYNYGDFNSNSSDNNEPDNFFKESSAILFNKGEDPFTTDVVLCLIVAFSLPFTLLAIYALYSQVKGDHVAPIYVINLLISDVIQLCCMMVRLIPLNIIYWIKDGIIIHVYMYCLLVSVGFMVCIAMERYLIIAWPLWYRFKRTIRITVAVCAVGWVLPLAGILFFHFSGHTVAGYLIGVFFLLPLLLLIFFLVGTLRALSASRVPSDEKRRVVGVLVLVLLIYILLFLPTIILMLTTECRRGNTLLTVSAVFVKCSPLADILLYVFMRKGIVDRLLARVCCCRIESHGTNGMSSRGISTIYKTDTIGNDSTVDRDDISGEKV